MKKSFFLILFLVGILFISSCGSHEDCSLKDSTYVKYRWDEELNKCIIAKRIQKNSPTNGIIEEGENYCNAPNDVPKEDPKLGCSGTVGEYLEKKCKGDTCVLTQNNKVVDKLKELEFKNSDLILQGKFSLKSPFIINTEDNNKVFVELIFFKEISSQKKISNLKIKSLTIMNSASEILAEHTYDKILPNVESSTPRIALSLRDTSDYKRKDSLKVSVVISYLVTTLDNNGEVIKTEEVKTTLKSSLGRWEIINPNFYEEK